MSRAAGFTIAHKSVSRKHLTISVSAVKPGNGSQIYTRSKLILEDENTKAGTEVDGEKIPKGNQKRLKNDEHAFRLGSYEHLFRIRWQPVVLSFTFPSKETKGGKDPLIPIRSRLEDLDIKTVIPYVVGKTTHVVAGKRNTAKCLQALVNGKYIVENSFLDALVYAATPSNLDEPESLSPLEEDFRANWPNALEHLPAPGREPGQRPSGLFAPNAERKDVFNGYIFIFCDQRQFDNLQPPITDGGGKALYYEVEAGKTPVSDLIRYVKDAAGDKGPGELADVSESRGVVVVHFQGAKGYEEWAMQLQHDLALAIGLRLVEQNEFLDAILTRDASKLRRALPTVWTAGSSVQDPNPATVKYPTSSIERSPGETAPSIKDTQPSQPAAPRVRPRGTIVSAFKGFDDGFDRSQISSRGNRFQPGSQAVKSTNGASQKTVSFAESTMEVGSQDNEVWVGPGRLSRKRSLSPSSGEDDMTERLLPAAAAMKRRRIEEEKEGRRKGTSMETTDQKSEATKAETKKIKVKKEMDIQKVVRGRREAEEAAARQDEESLRQAVDDMTVEEMKSLAVVEEMEVPERGPTNRFANDRSHHHWDERWNGRKNFKRFRRQGEGTQPRRGQTVMVPLVEARKSDYGIGGECWEGEKSKRRGRERERESQSQSQQDVEVEGEAAPAEPAKADEPEIIDVDTPRTRLRGRTSGTEQSSNAARNKRPAPDNGRSGAAKKQKTLAVEGRRGSSGSEDELKFRFRRRK